jgi:hypothetical protein
MAVFTYIFRITNLGNVWIQMDPRCVKFLILIWICLENIADPKTLPLWFISDDIRMLCTVTYRTV